MKLQLENNFDSVLLAPPSRRLEHIYYFTPLITHYSTRRSSGDFAGKKESNSNTINAPEIRNADFELGDENQETEENCVVLKETEAGSAWTQCINGGSQMRELCSI